MPSFTPHAIRLASVYFPILVHCAEKQQLISYGELVAQAKTLHPDSAEVQSAIPVSTGLKLDVIKEFCQKRSLPDLASLVVNRQTDEPGKRYDRRHIADTLQRQAFSFDWGSESIAFDAHIIEETKRAIPLVKRKEKEAGELLFGYYNTNRAQLPVDIIQYKPQILELLIKGHDVADAFEMALEG